ncbi:MAG: ABC transporter substrate-binding protein [Pseudomonadota bacterium]
MRRRLTTLFVALLALSLLLAACGGSKSAPPAQPAPNDKAAETPKPKEPVTVHIWSWRPQDKPLWEKVQQKLNAQGEPITIEFRGVKSTDYNSVMQTALAGGEGPDIFLTRAGAGTAEPAKAGQIIPLSDIKFEGFDEGTLSAVSHDGKVYAVPFAVQTLTFFYNKAIFDQHGLKEPATWDELIQLMESLKAKGVTPLAIGGKDAYAASFLVDVMAASHLGDAWIADLLAGKTNFQDPRFIEILKKANGLQQYAQKDVMATGQRDARTLFGTGQTAMIVDGIWAVNAYYLKTDPNIKLGSFLAPPLKAGETARLSSYVDGGIAINAKSKVQEAAKKIVAFTATAEFAQMYADLHSEIPGNRNVKFPESAPMLQRAVKQWNEVGLKLPFRIGSPLNNGTPDFSTSMGANLQGLMSGKLTAEQAAEAIQKDLAWYPPFKK